MKKIVYKRGKYYVKVVIREDGRSGFADTYFTSNDRELERSPQVSFTIPKKWFGNSLESAALKSIQWTQQLIERELEAEKKLDETARILTDMQQALEE